MFNENSGNSDFVLFKNGVTKASRVEAENKLSDTMQKITREIGRLEEKQAARVGWTRSMGRFSEGCLFCTARCHLRGQPDVQQDFLADLWKILPQYGVNPLKIQEALEQKRLQKPWTTTVAYSRDDIIKLISEQLGGKEA